jgi:hypothetical protein
MCIPYGAMRSQDNGYIEDKPKKHITKVSQKQFENGDPDFVDERTTKNEPKKKKESFFDSLVKDF